MRFCPCLYLLHKVSGAALKAFITLATHGHKTDVWRHICKDEVGESLGKDQRELQSSELP